MARRTTTWLMFYVLLFTHSVLSCDVGGLHIPDGGIRDAGSAHPSPAALGQPGNGRSAGHSARLQSARPGHHEQTSAQPQRTTDQRLAVLPLHGDRLLCRLRDGRCRRLVVYAVWEGSATQLLPAGNPLSLQNINYCFVKLFTVKCQIIEVYLLLLWFFLSLSLLQ